MNTDWRTNSSGIDVTILRSPERVQHCPKCGSDKGWNGPRYVVYEWGGRLLFACATCGYERVEPTKDAPTESQLRQARSTLDGPPSPPRNRVIKGWRWPWNR